VIIGISEGLLVVTSGRTDFFVVPYGTAAYALFCAAVGGAGLFALAWSGRMIGRAAEQESVVYARVLAGLTATFAFAIGAFRIRRDVFAEELVFKSGKGLLVLLGCAVAALALYATLLLIMRWFTSRRGRFLLRAWGSPLVTCLLVGGLVGATMFTKQPAAAEPARRAAVGHAASGNVIMIVVDTLRADHLPAYGYAKGHTPHLDAFARDAVRFEHAYANASWTRPSFASLLTGRYASSHHVMAKGDALSQNLTTLGEAFVGAGYTTSGFVTNYNVAPYFQFDQGFDEYHYLEPEFVLGADDAAAKLLLVQFLRQRIESLRDAFWGVQPGTAYQDAAVVNAELFRWLDRNPNTPWFLFVGYMDPHDPYFEHPYSGAGYGRAAHPAPGLHERERLTVLYDGEITYWDEHLGKLVAELKVKGVYDDTTIVITSDHGEELGEHGGFWHGTTLYDEQLRVPLFVKMPKNARAASTVTHWVQSIDIMPSLLRWSQIAVPSGVQGQDLFVGHERLFAEESHEGNVLASVREKQAGTTVKLIEANPGNPRGLAQREVYRMDLDPGETTNLSRTELEVGEQVARSLSAAREAAKKDAVQGQEVGLDPNARRQLCELGYLSPEDCK
jgi:arylsulfatase A-like enzyme